MLGSVVRVTLAKGIENIGSEPAPTAAIFRSLSMSNRIGLPLLAHVDRTEKGVFLPCSFPYTMGVAIASTAHAAKNRFPVVVVISCPVFSSDSG